MVILLYMRKVPNFYSMQLPRCADCIDAMRCASVELRDTSFYDIFRSWRPFSAKLFMTEIKGLKKEHACITKYAWTKMSIDISHTAAAG